MDEANKKERNKEGILINEGKKRGKALKKESVIRIILKMGKKREEEEKVYGGNRE